MAEGTLEMIIIWSQRSLVITPSDWLASWSYHQFTWSQAWTIGSSDDQKVQVHGSINAAQAWLLYGCGSWIRGGQQSRPSPPPPRGPRSPSRSEWTSSTWNARTWPSCARSCPAAAPSGCAGSRASQSQSGCWSWRPSCPSPGGRILWTVLHQHENHIDNHQHGVKHQGNHDENHLVKTLAGHLDPVHLQHLVVHC